MRRQPHRRRAAAMVSVAQRNHLVVAGVSARHQQREIVRFRTGVHEVANLQVTRHFRRELLRILGDVRMQINRRGMLERFVLLARRLDHVRMTMPDAHRHDSAERIEISAAMLVPQILHLPFHEHDRFFVVEKIPGFRNSLRKRKTSSADGPSYFRWLMVEWRKLRSFHFFVVIPSEVEGSRCETGKFTSTGFLRRLKDRLFDSAALRSG